MDLDFINEHTSFRFIALIFKMEAQYDRKPRYRSGVKFSNSRTHPFPAFQLDNAAILLVLSQIIHTLGVIPNYSYLS